MASTNKVVFDTSMLLSCGELKIDAFDETRQLLGNPGLFVTQTVEEEMAKLAKKGAKYRKNVAIAEILLEANNVKRMPAQRIKKNADKELEELAKKGYIVATNDAQLRKKIKKNGGKCIIVMKKKFLAIE